jgi:hypothetical protein
MSKTVSLSTRLSPKPWPGPAPSPAVSGPGSSATRASSWLDPGDDLLAGLLEVWDTGTRAAISGTRAAAAVAECRADAVVVGD